MIICSCNVFSDQQVRPAVANGARRLRMSQIYTCLGCSAQCGRCAHAIKRIIAETPNCAVRPLGPIEGNQVGSY